MLNLRLLFLSFGISMLSACSGKFSFSLSESESKMTKVQSASLNSDPLVWVDSGNSVFTNALNWTPQIAPDSLNPVSFNKYGISVVKMAGTVSVFEMRINQGRVAFDNAGSTNILNVPRLIVAAGVPDACPLGSQTLAGLSIGAGSTVTFSSHVPLEGNAPDNCVQSIPNPLPTISVPAGMSFTFADLAGSINIPTGMTLNVDTIELKKGAKLFLDGGKINATGGIIIDGGAIYSSVDQVLPFPISVLSGGATISVKANTTLTFSKSFSQVAGSVVNQIDKGTLVIEGNQFLANNSSHNVAQGRLELYSDSGKYSSGHTIKIGKIMSAAAAATSPVVGTLFVGRPQHLQSLQLVGKSLVEVQENSDNILTLKSLSIQAASVLNLSNNALILEYSGNSPMTDLSNHINAGRIVGTNPNLVNTGSVHIGIANASDLSWVVPDVTQYGFNTLSNHSILLNFTENPGSSLINMHSPVHLEEGQTQTACPAGSVDTISLPKYADSSDPQFHGYFSSLTTCYYSQECAAPSSALLCSWDPGFEYPDGTVPPSGPVVLPTLDKEIVLSPDALEELVAGMTFSDLEQQTRLEDIIQSWRTSLEWEPSILISAEALFAPSPATGVNLGSGRYLQELAWYSLNTGVTVFSFPSGSSLAQSPSAAPQSTNAAAPAGRVIENMNGICGVTASAYSLHKKLKCQGTAGAGVPLPEVFVGEWNTNFLEYLAVLGGIKVGEQGSSLENIVKMHESFPCGNCTVKCDPAKEITKKSLKNDCKTIAEKIRKKGDNPGQEGENCSIILSAPKVGGHIAEIKSASWENGQCIIENTDSGVSGTTSNHIGTPVEPGENFWAIKAPWFKDLSVECIDSTSKVSCDTWNSYAFKRVRYLCCKKNCPTGTGTLTSVDPGGDK